MGFVNLFVPSYFPGVSRSCAAVGISGRIDSSGLPARRSRPSVGSSALGRDPAQLSGIAADLRHRPARILVDPVFVEASVGLGVSADVDAAEAHLVATAQRLGDVCESSLLASNCSADVNDLPDGDLIGSLVTV